MEVFMEDQILPVDKEQEAISDADLARKLSKKERRLSERLLDAQEDEVRARDRFERAQARLQRRRDRLERITSQLALVQKQLVELQTTYQQPEKVEPELTTSEPTLLSDSDGSASVQSEPEAIFLPDTWPDIPAKNELEAVATPEPEAISVSPTAFETPTIIEPEPVAAPDSTISEPEAIPPSDTSATNEPELVATPDSTTVVVLTTTEPEAIPLSTSEPAASPTLEPEVEATPGIDSSSDSTTEREPTKPLQFDQETQPIAGSLSQDIQAAKEAWVQAESAMQHTRNTAHGIAASISFLSQTGVLSNEFMAELIRKQADANKALVKAQDAARIAYERFVQAQEIAEHAASQQVEVSLDTSEDHTRQKQENEENGTLPIAEEGNATDQTVSMHAIRLYKI
jgi:hypothetical protein